MSNDAIVVTLFGAAKSVLALMAMALLAAQFVLHRPIPLQIPSVYWPMAKLGFSPRTEVRRVFRCLFSRWYRKRFWNPLMDVWRKTKGFDRQRHVSSSNLPAVCSAMVLVVAAFFLYFAHRAALSGQSQAQRTAYLWALAVAGFELVYNAPAIVLSRYLYLLTTNRPGLTKI
jgi:hypothetical protein